MSNKQINKKNQQMVLLSYYYFCNVSSPIECVLCCIVHSSTCIQKHDLLLKTFNLYSF